MNRRKFIKKTSTGVLAASFLPLLSFAEKPAVTTDNYLVTSLFEAKGKDWLIKFSVNSDLISRFDLATKVDKQISFSAKENKEFSTLVLIYRATSKTEKTIDGKDLHFLNCEMQPEEMDAESRTFAKEILSKNISLEIHDKCHANLNYKKDKTAINFKYESPTDDNLQCFLTTASVFHKGLSDDCKELTILRNLRENVMKPNTAYGPLISEYEIIAPKMLLNINAASNRDEILEQIYHHLVLPSVSLVESGKNTAAIEHYRDFVQEMKKRYL